MFGRIEVDNIAKWIHGDTIDEGSYGPIQKRVVVVVVVKREKV